MLCNRQDYNYTGDLLWHLFDKLLLPSKETVKINVLRWTKEKTIQLELLQLTFNQDILSV